MGAETLRASDERDALVSLDLYIKEWRRRVSWPPCPSEPSTGPPTRRNSGTSETSDLSAEAQAIACPALQQVCGALGSVASAGGAVVGAVRAADQARSYFEDWNEDTCDCQSVLENAVDVSCLQLIC